MNPEVKTLKNKLILPKIPKGKTWQLVEAAQVPHLKITLEPRKYAFIFPNLSPITEKETNMEEEWQMYKEVTSFIADSKFMRRMKWLVGL